MPCNSQPPSAKVDGLWANTSVLSIRTTICIDTDDLYLGYTRNTMAVNRGKQSGDAEQNPKNGPSSDCRLQPAYTKLELLVIADQHAAVNTFPGLVHTARHTMGVCNTRSQ